MKKILSSRNSCDVLEISEDRYAENEDLDEFIGALEFDRIKVSYA